MPSVLTGATAALVTATTGVLAQTQVAARRDYEPNAPDFVVEHTIVPTQHPASPRRRAARAPLRLVAVGDSTVRGVGAGALAGALPMQVGARLAERAGRAVDVVGLGVSGARVADALQDQARRVAALEPDVVLCVVGANDATHAVLPGRFAQGYRELLHVLSEAVDTARGPGRRRVLAVGLGRFSGVGALAEPLRGIADRYADVLRERQRRIALALGATWVDLSVDASPRFRRNPAALSSDAFHPSAVGYALWADAIAARVGGDLLQGREHGA